MQPPLLEARQLCKHFGGVQALDGLDLKVERNHILGLIGPNGSGKTTFFNVVTGIYPASSGQVLLDGRDITNLAPQKVYRGGVARNFQRSRLLLPLSILENIALGDHARQALASQLRACREKAGELLNIFDPELAGRLSEPVASLPMISRWRIEISRWRIEISRWRIEISRALISEPKLLLLDEPSAGMTHDELFRLVDDILAVKERLSDLTIIIIEHEMTVMERSTDHCAVLNFGCKICEGAYAEVAADPQVQEAYLGVD